MNTAIKKNNPNDLPKVHEISDLDMMYDRNREFASGYEGRNLHIVPRYSTVILSCMDARVDPTHFLNLKLGEIFVMRNMGGRVTEGVERNLAFLWAMASQFTEGRSPVLSLAIIHHTDCGLERIANPDLQRKISHASGLELKVLDNLAITDHVKSIREDISRLQHSTLVPEELVVSGHLYNVRSGQLKDIVHPSPLKQEEKND